jgi:hypothetical protein
MWSMTSTVEIAIPSHELPDWMRQARRGIDWGVLLIFAFSLTIALPFITQNTLPHTNASENYVYRTEDYAAALREGRLYPRWSPNALTGYGAPIPHYYPPAPAYTAALIQVLFTGDAVLAVRLVYIAALSLAGMMTYLLVTRRAGARAGLLAGVLYVYSPYIGLTGPHILGDLPGVMSFALLPLLLWGVDKLLTRRFSLDVFLIALITAGFYLTSIRGAWISTLLAIALVGWHRHDGRRVPWLRGIGAYLLGIGAAGFYWIPALLEYDAVHWRTATIPTALKLTPTSLITPAQEIDLGTLLPAPQLSMGLALVILGIAGAISTYYFRRESSFQILFLILGLGMGGITLVFFPHDIWLLSTITFCIAIGSTAVLHWRGNLPRQWRRSFLPALLVLVWITAIPVWLPPLSSDPFGAADALAQVQYELQGYGTAVVPPGQPIPSTLSEGLSPNRLLIEGYQANNINKIAAGQMSAGVQIGVLEHDTHADIFQIRASVPLTLNVLTAYFSGWRASISGQAIPLRPDPITGLIQIEVPVERTGELQLSLGTTLVRAGAWIITWVCCLIVLIITWGKWRRRTSGYDEIEQFSLQEARLLTILLICFSVIILLFNNPGFPLTLRPRAGYAMQNSTFIQNRTDTGLSLLAFNLRGGQHRRGDAVPLTLYWQTQRFLSENYQVQLYLTNAQTGSRSKETSLRHPGNYPTRRWKTGLYVADVYELILSSEIEPGNYQINVEVFTCNPDCTTGEQITFFNTNGQSLNTTLRLPALIVVSG